MFSNEEKFSGATRQKAKGFRTSLMVSVAAVWLGAMSVSTANAGTIVTSWDFNLDNAFVEFIDTNGDVGGASEITGSKLNPALGAPTMLSWGTPNNEGGLNPDFKQSSLQVGLDPDGNFNSAMGDGPAILTDIPGTLVPPASAAQAGNIVNTVKVTHDNNQITLPDVGNPLGTEHLASAKLLDVLTLFPLLGDGGPPMAGPLPLSPLLIAITFVETANAPNNGDPGETGADCSDITSPDGGGCNDIFVVDVPGAAFDPMDGSLNQMFEFDDFAYNAKINLDGLGMLADDVCAEAGAAMGCIGLTTIENMANEFQARLSIQLKGAVPEPGALAVFGLGLVGLGFTRRRTRKKLAA